MCRKKEHDKEFSCGTNNAIITQSMVDKLKCVKRGSLMCRNGIGIMKEICWQNISGGQSKGVEIRYSITIRRFYMFKLKRVYPDI